jgi:signal peptidase II
MVLTRRDIGTALALLLADQITKWLALYLQPRGTIFEFTWNTGAGFGILQGQNVLLAAISIIAMAVLWPALKASKGHERVAWVVIYAGILGNFIDRIIHGAVIDFISIGTFPVFNIADSCITLGVAYLLASAARDWFPAWRFRKGKLEK